MAHQRMRVRAFVVFLGLVAVGAFGAAGRAQVGLGEQIGSDQDLQKGYNQHYQTYQSLMRGDVKKDAKEMQAVAKAMAEWYLFRLTFHANKADPKKMARLVDDFETDMRIRVPQNKNPEFQRIYAKELIKCFEPVLGVKKTSEGGFLDPFNVGDQPAIFNACTLMPTFAKFRTDDIAKFLTELVTNGKAHDTVRLWAMKSMGELPPVRIYGILDAAKNDPALIERKNLDLKRADALLAFLVRKMPQNVTPDAERFLRRQAIRALAQTEAPAVEIDKVNKVHGPVAYGLLRALARNKEGLQPPPTVTERLEAAIGVCHLKFNDAALRDLYQPDVGIYFVGLFMGDFIDAYRADFPRFGVGVVKKVKGETFNAVPVQPWKIHAKRMETALGELSKNARTTRVDDKVKKFVPYCQKFLVDMQNHKAMEAFDRIMIESTLRPKDATIFYKAKDKEPDFLKKDQEAAPSK